MRIFKKDYTKLLLVVIFLLGILSVFMVIYFPNYARLKRMKVANNQLIIKINKLHREIKNMQSELSRVDKGPSVMEKISRNQLGLAKKGEIVVDIKQ